jgi:hypothetical protein
VAGGKERIVRATLLIAWVWLALPLGLALPATADDTQDMIDQASLEEFQSYLEVLTGVVPVPGFPHYYLPNRYSLGTDILVAAQWIRSEFESCGLDATLHTYDTAYGPNVIGELPGTTRPDDIYIYCGHYDTYHYADQSHAPGCDDNGSGTAAVLMAARILSQYAFEGTIRFIAFSGEEQWMVGSQAYAAEAAAEGENIIGAINLDMFLQPGFDNQDPDPDYDLDIGGDNASQWLALYLADRFAAYTPIDFQVHNDAGFVSDQWAFWQYGYHAVGLIENTPQEIWGGSNDAYHQLTDTMDNPDYDWGFALHAVRGSMAGLIDLAIPICFGDLDDDGSVNLTDLAQLLSHYGTTSGATYTDGDVDGDGDVDLADLADLLAVYGTVCD